MKKLTAVIAALMIMVCGCAACFAEESNAPTFTSGVKFNMDMDQVMQLVNLPNPEIEREKTRGSVEFWELEYENVIGGDGINGDIKFSFVGNSLVAIHCDLEEGTSYETIRQILTDTFGDAVPFDAARIRNGRYVIDDDGDLKNCREMIAREDLIVVLERDHDGDVDVTILDPTAAYINN